MAALLFVRNLIFDLQRAGACFDHLLGEQIGCLGIAETGVDIGDDRNDMGFEILDGIDQIGLCGGIAGVAGLVEITEEEVEFASIGLAQEGVQFLDQRRNAGLFVHRLVGQGAEFAAQRGDHPAGEIEVALLGGAEMLLDRNHLLLRDEAVPAAERLGVIGWIGIIGSHVVAHDLGGVAGDIEAGLETVLQAHAGDGFGVDRIPGSVLRTDQLAGGLDFLFIGHCDKSLFGRSDTEASYLYWRIGRESHLSKMLCVRRNNDQNTCHYVMIVTNRSSWQSKNFSPGPPSAASAAPMA